MQTLFTKKKAQKMHFHVVAVELIVVVEVDGIIVLSIEIYTRVAR